jgi:hypothetical protein
MKMAQRLTLASFPGSDWLTLFLRFLNGHRLPGAWNICHFYPTEFAFGAHVDDTVR